MPRTKTGRIPIFEKDHGILRAVRAKPCVPVTVEFEGPAGRPVSLVGDFPDWKYPIPMTETMPGVYSVEIALEPGIYRYKFLLDRKRYVDVPNPSAVDRAEGAINGLIIVGGTQPPLYFAPDRRHAVLFEDGVFRVQGETEDGAAVPPWIWVRADTSSQHCEQHRGGHSHGDDRGNEHENPRSAGAPLTRIPVHSTTRRNGRAQFWAEHTFEPGSPEHNGCGWYGFANVASHIFRLPEPRSRLGMPPSWLDGATFYAIFIDRWRRSSTSEPDPRARPRSAPTVRDSFYGGDLAGITEDLDYIAGLGVDGIILTPLNVSPTPHRYDPIDLHTIDPSLGGAPAFERLVAKAHERKLRVVADLSATHVNEDHPAFRDVLEKQAESTFASWFRIRSFPVMPYKTFGNYDFYYDRPDLPLLNLEPGEAREHVIQAALQLVKLGVDGLRLDALNDAPVSFWQELRARGRALNPELLFLGEIVTDRPVRFAESLGIDTGTDFQHREAILDFFAESRIDATEFWNRVCFLVHRLGPFHPSFRLLFLDNHDTERFLSLAQDVSRLQVALCYLLFRPEPVWLTYGTELGFGTGLGRVMRLDDAWPERLPVPDPLGLRAPAPIGPLLTALTRIRREVLRASGAVTCVAAQGQHLVLERELPVGNRVRLTLSLERGGEFELQPQETMLLSVPFEGTPSHGVGRAHITLVPSRSS